ncbi:UDP-glycosyltransferase 91A1 [Solanum lycopersicum]
MTNTNRPLTDHTKMAKNSKMLHIGVFPWLAFGHMIPYLELSKLIAQKGHKISFISTPRNIDRLPKLSPNLTPFLNFVKLPMPYVENLPENAEATTDVTYEQVKYLKLAQDGLEESMAKFLEDSDLDFILFDFTSYWVPSIASKFNIRSGHFSIYIAAFLGFTGPVPGLNNDYEIRTTPEEYTVPPKWVPFETTVAFKLFEVLRIFEATMKGEEENIADITRYYKSVENCDFLFVRSCSELEPEWLKVLGDIHRKPVLPVGQLPTTPYEDDSTKIDAWIEIKLWLDKREKGKVIYVAFGSEAKSSQNELIELSLGLELSGLSFLWVLRTKRGESDDELVQLPEGFEDRMKGRGIVCTSWAPQLKILSHDSVGGFLTHSGWSSVVEAIQYEKPLVLLTFSADQGINARLLEEKKIAYSIPRDDCDGSFTRDSVAKSLNLVLIEKEGEIYREKVKQMKSLFCDKERQDNYVDNLLCYLQNYKKTIP